MGTFEQLRVEDYLMLDTVPKHEGFMLLFSD